jgi:hypothetical protein
VQPTDLIEWLAEATVEWHAAHYGFAVAQTPIQYGLAFHAQAGASKHRKPDERKQDRPCEGGCDALHDRASLGDLSDEDADKR